MTSQPALMNRAAALTPPPIRGRRDLRLALYQHEVNGQGYFAFEYRRPVGVNAVGVMGIGEAHLRRRLSDYEKHEGHERNHQGLGNRSIAPLVAGNGRGPVRRDSRAAALLSFYASQAA